MFQLPTMESAGRRPYPVWVQVGAGVGGSLARRKPLHVVAQQRRGGTTETLRNRPEMKATTAVTHVDAGEEREREKEGAGGLGGGCAGAAR